MWAWATMTTDDRSQRIPGMPSNALPSFIAPESATDFVSRASALLAAEVARFQPPPTSHLGSESAPALPHFLLPPAVDDVRRQASDVLDQIFSRTAGAPRATSTASASGAEQVPLILALAPVRPGERALATVRIANEEAAPARVTLYSSNFITDSGYELGSLMVSVEPRVAEIAPGAEASFDVEVAVPTLAPAGFYSGLVQAAGTKYLKAVITFEVL